MGDFIREEVLRLSYTAVDLAPMARDLCTAGGSAGQDAATGPGPAPGSDAVPDPYPWDDDDRRHRMARLDALFFHLYGIPRADAAYILDQFPIIECEDEQTHGRYLTRDLILAYMNSGAAGDLAIRVTV